MGFGKRTEAPASGAARTAAPTPLRPRRGGYWLGLLAQLATATITLVLMPFISQFKLNGATLSTLAAPAALALLNLTAVGGVLMLLVDLALRALGWRNPWIYALACGLAALVFYAALALAIGLINPLFALYLAVWPAAVGGWVLGRSRRQNAVGR